MKVVFTLSLLLFCTISIVGQEADGNFPPPEVRREVQAARATGSIKIDGKLDEADWRNAIPVTDFFRMEPRQGGDYQYKTEVRLLFDDQYLGM